MVHFRVSTVREVQVIMSSTSDKAVIICVTFTGNVRIFTKAKVCQVMGYREELEFSVIVLKFGILFTHVYLETKH